MWEGPGVARECGKAGDCSEVERGDDCWQSQKVLSFRVGDGLIAQSMGRVLQEMPGCNRSFKAVYMGCERRQVGMGCNCAVVLCS